LEVDVMNGSGPLRTRSAIEGIAPYKPDRAPVAIDLSDNTNRWGAPPAAVRELGRIASVSARYPDAYSESLVGALATYAGVDPECVVVGAGSDNVLDAAIRAFGEAGDALAYASPSFQMVPVFARVNGLRADAIPFTASGDVDVDALLAGEPAIVYLCSPNNPTGLPIPRATIESVIERAPGLVIVDEAYFEFNGSTIVDLVRGSPRLLVVRTLSKAWGLAGLRIGYGIAQPALIGAIEASRGPYTVALPSERAAGAALAEDREWMMRNVAAAVENRETFSRDLAARGWTPLASASNFVLVPAPDAAAIASALRAAGIAVRHFTGLDFPHATLRAARGNALRISIGPREEMDALLAALDAWKASCE
jgi:histidinol-phosphate aminotransferase